jgi:hypothetical protein
MCRLTCANAADGRRETTLAMAGGGVVGGCCGRADTPLTCTNTDIVSSDASLNHWM